MAGRRLLTDDLWGRGGCASREPLPVGRPSILEDRMCVAAVLCHAQDGSSPGRTRDLVCGLACRCHA